MPATRQLAAILFADIVGFTAIMQKDETRALQWLQRLKSTLEEAVNLHQGRILEIRGDGVVCIFNSTILGVKAAVALQLEMRSDPEIPLRIGMHTGDILFNENTIYGDGVNIASRMESFATAGSILISDKVYDDIKNQRDILTQPLGKYHLKNISQPVDIFAVSNPGLIVPRGEILQGKGQKEALRNCMLVLPFINISNDPEQEYFSDGLTDELITNLSGLREMKIISRTTSMKYKGTTKDIKDIHEETGAHFVMEGSVRKQGTNLRINAQFIDARNDTQVWSETYHGTMDDIFDIQEDVAQKIVQALQLQLTHAEKGTLEKRFTDNTEAYQLYLQGRFFWKKRNAEGLKTAIKYFKLAIKSDPEYALAWAGLADTYSLMGDYSNISRRKLYPKIMHSIDKALELDRHLAEVHTSLAISLMLNEWDWINAEKEFKLSIELNPNYATAHHWYAEWLLFTGHSKEAFKEITLASELDPFSQGILKDKGIFHYYLGQFDDALDIAYQTLELDPGFAPAYRLLSLAYHGKGMFDKSIVENKKWGELIRNTINPHCSES